MFGNCMKKMDVDLLTFRMFGNGEKVYQKEEEKTWIEFKFFRKSKLRKVSLIEWW